MRILACSLVLLIGAPLAAAAQPGNPAASRGSVVAAFGGGHTWDDESSIGTGPLVGGRVQWRLFGGTSIEGSADALWYNRSGGVFEAEGRTIFFGATLLQRLIGGDSSPAQFFVLGGVHLAKHSGSTTFEGVRRERNSTDTGYHFGVGTAIRITERMDLGPEARFYMIQADNGSSPAWAYSFGGRLGFRF